MENKQKTIVVALTGASGSLYALRLVEVLLQSGCTVAFLASRSGLQVLEYETGLKWSGSADQIKGQVQAHFGETQRLHYFDENDFFAPVASGSSAPQAMVILPCSMGTAGRIAGGLSSNLIERVADVALKEGRPLLLVPRETPFNTIHLENLLRLSRAGARIIPAMPAFYHRPHSIEDLVDFVVGKVLDSLGVGHDLFQRWGSEPV